MSLQAEISSDDRAIETLINRIAELPQRDQDFAGSLINQYLNKGSLSDRQWPYVHKFADKILNPPAAIVPEKVANAAKIHSLFETAKANGLKRAAIRVHVENFGDVRVSTASESSINAGFLYVKVDDEYVGKIAPTGEFYGIRSVEDRRQAIQEALNALAANPVSVAKAYGGRTGNCCFCGKELTDGRSVDVGYGPICAANYGLPWGE